MHAGWLQGAIVGHAPPAPLAAPPPPARQPALYCAGPLNLTLPLPTVPVASCF